MANRNNGGRPPWWRGNAPRQQNNNQDGSDDEEEEQRQPGGRPPPQPHQPPVAAPRILVNERPLARFNRLRASIIAGTAGDPPPLHYTNDRDQVQDRLAYLQVAAQLDRVNNLPRGRVLQGNGQAATANRWMVTVSIPDHLQDPLYRLPNPVQTATNRGYGHLSHPIVYVTGQYELGQNGDPAYGDHLHIQMYLESAANSRINWRDIFMAFGWGMPDSQITEPWRIWMEPSHAPVTERVVEYVTREDKRYHIPPELVAEGDPEIENPFAWGQPNPGQVANQHDNIMGEIFRGDDYEELALRHGQMFAQRHNFYMSLIKEREKKDMPKDKKKEVVLLYGAAGTGKTRLVYQREQNGDGSPNVYSKIGGRFWDGYMPRLHKVVLLDDFVGEASGLTFDQLLKVLDRHPHGIEIKGAMFWLRADKIYLTSNLHWREWFPRISARQQQALLRRFTGGVYEFMENGDVIEEYPPDDEYKHLLFPEQI